MGTRIKDAALVGSVGEGYKIPVSDGSNQPKTASVGQIGEFVNQKYGVEQKLSELGQKVKTKDIELWGDSLTAQNYGKFLSGANVSVHGYGGKSSTYIRDKFIEGCNKKKTQVIWVGRNNYRETDVVVDDIRDMITHFGNRNFIVMCPPNGQWGDFGTNGADGTGELNGGNDYAYFIELEKRLEEEWPSNFLNIRKAVIQGWRMGNVKLLDNYTQPEKGGEVTIHVSDAAFLTTYNPNDLERWGEDIMKKIRIGINGNYDVYDIVESVDNTHIVIRLAEVNNIQPGGIVGNKVEGGGLESIKYIRVVQNADYLCWLYNTTLSTFRKDGIHMTEDGCKLVADVVAKKLASMRLLDLESGSGNENGGDEEKEYIEFADANVRRILIDSGIGDGNGITVLDAASVTNLNGLFKGNTDIVSFDECKYFGLSKIGTSEFEGCSSLRTIVLPEGMTTIEWEAFKGCSSLTDCAMPDSVHTIYSAAFNGTILGGDIVLQNLKTLGNEAFKGTNITSFTSHELESVPNYGFYGCKSLKSVDVPKVTKVETLGFGSSGIENIVLKNATYIGKWAFADCNSMGYIIVDSVTPPDNGGSMFNNTTHPIFVPAESVDAYKSADGWSAYSSRIKSISEMPSE